MAGFKGVVKTINGGYIGLKEREVLYNSILKKLKDYHEKNPDFDFNLLFMHNKAADSSAA